MRKGQCQMFYDLSREQREIRQQMKARRQALVESEARAAIAEAAETLRKEPASYLGIYDAAEPFSDKQRELTDAVESWHAKSVTRRLRKLYFSVQDTDLRQQLIAKTGRKRGELTFREI
jgi:hypothetical protein